jgi:ubiquinone/menaquinone biosynthesis C-methylase UbiE
MLTNPIRKLFQDPSRLLGRYVDEGMVVLEPGCGMGFFTLELARRVGTSGKVIALDLQPRMLDGLRKRARRAELLERIDIRRTEARRLAIDDLMSQVDFALAFYVVHELPNPLGFFAEVQAALRREGRLLIVEPRDHGGGEAGLQDSIDLAVQAGMVVVDRPTIKRNQVALLGKQ